MELDYPRRMCTVINSTRHVIVLFKLIPDSLVVLNLTHLLEDPSYK